MLKALKISEGDLSVSAGNGPVEIGGIVSHAGLFSNHKTILSEEVPGGFIVAAISRIHEKEELLNKLGIPFHMRSGLSDGDIFLRCFEKWRYDCPKNILGEWVLALWNSEEQELFLATSHFYGPNLYYCNTGHAFYFSNSLKALLVLDDIPKEINEFRLVRLMLKGSRYENGETIYKNIHRLGPAHSIRISANRFDIKRYWILEETSPIRYKTDNEYVEAFREIYKEAVKCRIATGNHIGSMLSGGLDSGSVTALAARELKKQNKILPAFSSVPLFDVSDFENLCADETRFINATANYAGNVEVNFIKSEGLSPVRALHKFMNMFDEPVGITPNIYWILSLIENANAKGIDTLLRGKHGNMTISWKGLFTGAIDWQSFLKQIRKGSIVDVRTIAGAVKNHLITPAVPETLYNYLQKRKNLNFDWYKDSPINKSFAEEHKFIEWISDFFISSRDPRNFQIEALNPCYGAPPFWGELGRQYNIWSTDPTADKRILEFCTSIPNEQFYRKGTKRYLFKRAMKGIMPDEVIFNTMKGKQAADFRQRFLQDMPEIKSIVESIKASEICNYYLDVKKIESALPLIEQDNFDSTRMMSRILFRGIAFGLFLQRFE
jgi:asparagine synthase (glutamine-hydrolysing)